MRISPKVFFSLLLLICLGCSSKQPEKQPMQIAGWLEQVRIQPSDILLHAKLDSGADSCSVSARDIDYIKKEDQDWVSFTVKNRYGQISKLEQKLLRTVKIKTKTGGFQVRPVVSLGVCIEDVFEYVECNLVDRSHFDYPVLIGRNFLSGSFLVNPSETYITSPNCPDE